MNLRSTCLCLCAGLLIVGAAHAQAPAPMLDAPLPPAPPVIPLVAVPGQTGIVAPPTAKEVRAVEAMTKDTQIAARVEVWFSGAQQERFVFEEGDSAITREKGIDLRTVGTGAIEMGSRKTSVSVLREDSKPEVFHTRFVTSTGGQLDAVVTLQIGAEQTLTIPGGKPTKVTVKRLR